MKWERLHPEPDRYDFNEGDALVTFAQKNGMGVYGHALVWDLQLPTWVTEANYTRQEWTQVLCNHIKTIVNHYQGKVYAWDVVNEALDDNGQLRNTFWLRAIGPDYVAMAFYWAHEADPQAILAYNDHSAEGMNRKSQGVYELVQALIEQGVPIHAVGLQMHTRLDFPINIQELSVNMERLSKLGLQIHITEMDVLTFMIPVSQRDKLIVQAQLYRWVFAVCLNNPSCGVFVVWGLADNYSWLITVKGLPDAPLLFDNNYQSKPAYFGILELMGPKSALDPGWSMRRVE
jgi:endo-1,4-beta-xylanase